MIKVSPLSYAILNGEEELKAAVHDVARLRMEVFKEHPYLYDGSLEYEMEYLGPFAASQSSMLVIAKLGDKIIGCITGTPLCEAGSDCQMPFTKAGTSTDSIFYLGEIVLLKEFRVQGIGAKMYVLFEKYVRDQKKFDQIAMCEVVREEKHDYFKLDTFWSKRQFVKYPKLTTQFAWKELGKEEKIFHTMVYWIKKF
jgi:hypothetical protein